MNHFKRNWLMVGAFLTTLLVSMLGCKKEAIKLTTTEDVNITGYFDKYPEEFSMFSQILERSGTSSYLAAYGTYTLFAPTNTAVTGWLESIGKQSLEQVDVEQLKDLVKYHLIEDTISTSNFGDGKIERLTLYGQYLLTGASNVGGVSRYTLNKDVNITRTNIRVGNGIIHVLDKMLQPATRTLAQTIKDNPEYSIFYRALEETKFIDTLNTISTDPARKFLTVVAESNTALKAININSYDDLFKRFSHLKNPTDHRDSLWLYVAYHIIPGANYVADIATSNSFSTLAPQEIVTAKVKAQKVLLNDDDFNGVLEPGVEVVRAGSDITASNGVLHSAAANYKIKVRFPTPVYFDLGNQAELKGKSGYQTLGAPKIVLATGANTSIVPGIIFNNASATQSSSYLNAGANDWHVFKDILGLSFGLTAARHKWIEFVTPMLVKGKYRVWMCYRAGNAANLQGTFDAGTPDEQLLPNIVVTNNNLGAAGVNLSDPNSANLLYAQGYKRYTAAPATENRWIGRLMGTVDVKVTDRHKLRLTMVGGRDGTETTTLDMIHFIPVEMDQLIRFDKDGKKLDANGNPLN